MKSDHHFALQGLQKSAMDLSEKIAAELIRAKAEIAKLGTKEYLEKYSGAFHELQVKETRKQHEAHAAGFQADLLAIQNRIAKSKAAWTTEAVLRRAVLDAESTDTMSAVLRELKLLRLSSEAKTASRDDFLNLLNDEAAAKNLSGVLYLAREASRRTGVDGLALKTATDHALTSLLPAGEQEVAAQFIDAAEKHLAAAEDSAIELATGKEPLRAQAVRLGQQYRERQTENAAA